MKFSSMRTSFTRLTLKCKFMFMPWRQLPRKHMTLTTTVVKQLTFLTSPDDNDKIYCTFLISCIEVQSQNASSFFKLDSQEGMPKNLIIKRCNLFFLPTKAFFVEFTPLPSCSSFVVWTWIINLSLPLIGEAMDSDSGRRSILSALTSWLVSFPADCTRGAKPGSAAASPGPEAAMVTAAKHFSGAHKVTLA